MYLASCDFQSLYAVSLSDSVFSNWMHRGFDWDHVVVPSNKWSRVSINSTCELDSHILPDHVRSKLDVKKWSTWITLGNMLNDSLETSLVLK